ncbi:outer membrane beta-barrel domain-containing protein [bacterium]|nr:outer membrane beta-barrel domain-containing protein [bacterium]
MWKTLLPLAFAGVSSVSWAGPQAGGRLLAMTSGSVSDAAPAVLQNRFFTKQLRLETGVSAGTILNESYSSTSSFGGRVGLFLSEKVGLEYNFSKFAAADSADLMALRRQEVCVALECRSIEPSFVRLIKSHQLQLVTAPVYGKINLFDWLILYSDLTLSAGAARVETSQGQKWAVTPGIGQRFYFSRSFSLRVDATDVYLKQSVTSGETTVSNWRHNWVAQFGLSAFLNSGE